MSAKRSRAPARMRALGGALLSGLRPGTRRRAEHPRSILVLHDLLLGDTLMLAPLLAVLRAKYPAAAIWLTAAPAVAPLFSGRPYGARALAFDERGANALAQLAEARDCDIAFLPGDARLAVTARALGARWIVGFAKALPRWKNWLVDEPVAFPSNPAALGDIFASLAGPAAPLLYDRGDWPAPACKPFEAPAAPYAVLHVGARSPLRHWDPARWSMLAAELSRRGMHIALTAGPGEGALIDAIDPGHRYVGYPGSLDLAQLWHLMAGAKAVVTLDTGVAHLAKLTGTPTACIFGPGSAPLLGRGRFWSAAPFTEVTVADFPCRDQPTLFKRHVAWVRHCSRGRKECSRARCMEAIEVSDVLAALGR